MSFKYYDTLSNLIIGVVFTFFINRVFYLVDEVDAISLLALGYLVGYFVNAISAMLESSYFLIMRGTPSDVLLTFIDGQAYTGYKRIKFYQCGKARELLTQELGDTNASMGKMFSLAMSYSNNDNNTRVPDFNAQYAFARGVFTLCWMMTIILVVRYTCTYLVWLTAIAVTILAFFRFKERGYYYAREVLTEYIHKKEQYGKRH